jgi:surface protein
VRAIKSFFSLSISDKGLIDQLTRKPRAAPQFGLTRYASRIELLQGYASCIAPLIHAGRSPCVAAVGRSRVFGGSGTKRRATRAQLTSQKWIADDIPLTFIGCGAQDTETTPGGTTAAEWHGTCNTVPIMEKNECICNMRQRSGQRAGRIVRTSIVVAVMVFILGGCSNLLGFGGDNGGGSGTGGNSGSGTGSGSGSESAAITLQFDTETGNSNTVQLPLHGRQENIRIDWGDGSEPETIADASSMRWISHTYETPGEYAVEIHGSLEGYGDESFEYQYNDADYQDRGRSSLTAVLDWRRVNGITSFHGGFAGARNLTDVPDYLPKGVRTTEHMFSEARAFNDPDVIGWETSQVTTMAWMFHEAWSFNQPIGSWDTSQVTSMRAMFFHSWGDRDKASFNQDLNGWDTSQVTDMYRMFMGQDEFNGAIGDWDVSRVRTMEDMFRDVGAFNQDIGNWDTGRVTNMQYMFRYTHSFNQDIGGWDVSSVTKMGGMFRQARVFHQDLSGWCVEQIGALPADPHGSDRWWHRWGGDVLHGKGSDGSVKADAEDPFLPQWGTCPQ